MLRGGKPRQQTWSLGGRALQALCLALGMVAAALAGVLVTGRGLACPPPWTPTSAPPSARPPAAVQSPLLSPAADQVAFHFADDGTKAAQEPRFLTAFGATYLKPPDLTPAQEELLQRIASYESKLTARQLRLSRISMGETSRLRRVVDKLIRGEPVSVNVVGGSISAGSGALKPGTGWVLRLFDWIRTTFPVTLPATAVNETTGEEFQRSEHFLKNGACPGTKSDYLAALLTHLVQQDAELVFIEYAVNDPPENEPWPTNQGRRSFERLLRRLLTYRNSPAVVLQASYAWRPADVLGKYWKTAEDGHGVLAQFYGLPWISLRGCCYHAMRRGEDGFRVELPATEEDRCKSMYTDWVHPYGLTGHRYLAEMAMALITETVFDVLARPFSEEDVEQVAAPIPDPMLPDNFERKGEMCFVSDYLGKFITEQQGFTWVNEQPDKHAPGKWGWVATEPESWLHASINELRNPAAKGTATVMLEVGYLRSYEHMGRFRVTCHGGCACDDVELDACMAESAVRALLRWGSQGWWPERVSLSSIHAMEVSGVDEGCVLRLEVLPDTSSPDGEHKVKFTALLLSEEASKEVGEKKFGNTDCRLFRSIHHLATEHQKKQG